jgi:hypothetical protein
MVTGMRARMATMRMRMRRNRHRKPMIDQCRMCRTEGIAGLTLEPVMSTDMVARMAILQWWMLRMKHSQLMMHQH